MLHPHGIFSQNIMIYFSVILRESVLPPDSFEYFSDCAKIVIKVYKVFVSIHTYIEYKSYMHQILFGSINKKQQVSVYDPYVSMRD